MNEQKLSNKDFDAAIARLGDAIGRWYQKIAFAASRCLNAFGRDTASNQLGAHSLGLQGRNDPGVYWPLFATVLLYVASFALRRTRRLLDFSSAASRRSRKARES